MEEKMVQFNFRLPERELMTLKSVAISCRMTVTEILRKLISEKIAQFEKEDLIERLWNIDPVDRLNILHKIQAEEVESGDKGKAKKRSTSSSSVSGSSKK